MQQFDGSCLGHGGSIHLSSIHDCWDLTTVVWENIALWNICSIRLINNHYLYTITWEAVPIQVISYILPECVRLLILSKSVFDIILPIWIFPEFPSYFGHIHFTRILRCLFLKKHWKGMSSLLEHLIHCPSNNQSSYFTCAAPYLKQFGITKESSCWVVIDITIPSWKKKKKSKTKNISSVSKIHSRQSLYDYRQSLYDYRVWVSDCGMPSVYYWPS